MKIIVIGSPGSGKSTLSKQLKSTLNLPLLHLDRIYHIDNERHISRDELMHQVYDFANTHPQWIIDGNYISTVEKRIQLADTIIYLKIPPEICLRNIKSRAIKFKDKARSDMAPGFKDGLLSDAFVNFVETFNEETSPIIDNILLKYKDKKIMVVKDLNHMNDVMNDVKKTHS